LRDSAGVPGEWAFDRVFDAIVRELIEERAADVEMASTARREMADIKREEKTTADVLQRQAGEDRATFRETLEDARERSGEKGVDVSYDSADEEQDRRATVVARYLVSLGYAEMQTIERPSGHPSYRVRFLWDKLRRRQEPSE
jgi:hypothetical protein